MKKIFLLLMFLLIGCGGGGGGSSSSITGPTYPPAISNLSYSPKSASLNEGNGAVTVYASYDYADADGDLQSFKISDTLGFLVITEGDLSSVVGGKTAGNIYGTVIVKTTSKGTTTFQFWVVDKKGNESNKLSGTFTVS